jgi:DMSO/TMAO reductase YedYZ heme-binding membrane subunit
MYGAVVVLASSWVRKRLGTKRWRRLHLLAVPAFILAMVHGVFTGTDTVRPWMWWIYASTGAVVLFLLVVRGLTANIRPTRAGPPDSRHPVRRQNVEGNGSAIPTPAGVATAAFPDPTRRRLEPSRP